MENRTHTQTLTWNRAQEHSHSQNWSEFIVRRVKTEERKFQNKLNEYDYYHDIHSTIRTYNESTGKKKKKKKKEKTANS